ncbi:MAG: DUF983 domain-containing protein [Rhodobacteraceae bacterium]|nr:DUF983 domain-containing protein [Paracoccaceae bacterium]
MDHAEAQIDDRPLGPSLLSGLRCTCPACGKAPLLHSYLKVHDTCPGCGEEYHHQRADDGPAYLTLLITLKITVPLMVSVMFLRDWHPAELFAIFGTLHVALSLLLLPRLKGMTVAWQWSRRMHGFGSSDERHH